MLNLCTVEERSTSVSTLSKLRAGIRLPAQAWIAFYHLCRLYKEETRIPKL